MRADFSVMLVLTLLFVDACSPDMGIGVTNAGAGLSSLRVTGGTLSPAFSPRMTKYTMYVPFSVNAIEVTATTSDPRGTVQITGVEVASGVPCGPINMRPGPNPIVMVAQTPEGERQLYDLIVWRAPYAREDYLKASNTDRDDGFGTVALSGDTLAVGAPNEDSSATGVNGNQANNSAVNSGAVYIFKRTGTVWTQQAYLKASNTDENDSFGSAVALSGDTLAVGAPLESSSATGINGNQSNNNTLHSGAVYVFMRTGTVWTQQAYLKASDTGASDQFGWSVALSGDTLAVGAVSEDSGATGVNGNQADNNAENSGAVYVFTRTGTVWTQQAYLKASNTERFTGCGLSDSFGWSVALSGDTLAVGAIGEDSNATGANGDQANNNAENSGAVYVFTRTGTVWTQQAYLKASNTEGDTGCGLQGDMFGSSVTLSGDTLAVGAIGEDSNATGANGDQANNNSPNSGAVYVFMRTGTSWMQQAYLKASNTDLWVGNANGHSNYFGNSISCSGDTLAVGAIWEDGSATGVNGSQDDQKSINSGAVYVFTRTGIVWTQQAYLKASNTHEGGGFGQSIALSSDTLAVGTGYEWSSATGVNGDQTDRSAAYSGAVYVFR